LTEAAAVAADPGPAAPPADRRAGWLFAIVLALPVLGGVLGSFRVRSLPLNFGPGDGPFVAGFAPEYEIDDKVATRWTSYDATVRLPLVVSGPAALSYRFARVLPETAVVDVAFDGRAVDHFTCRGGLVQERRVELGRLESQPTLVRFQVDSHDRRNLGLRMDGLRLELAAPARVRLARGALWRPVAVLALLGLVLIGGGWRPFEAALSTLSASAVATAGLILDPWLTFRLLRGLPLALALGGAAGIALGRFLVRRRRADPLSLRWVTLLGLLAFLLRGLAVNHPDFYYPDLKTHASLVALVREGGLDFLRSPERYIWNQGLWRTEAYGRTYAFPYSPAFHVPFAFVALPTDTLVTAMKLTAAALTVVPLALVFALGRRLDPSPLTARLASVLMLAVPTYTSRLSYAFLAALFGHACDTGLVAWLAGHLRRLGAPRVFLAGALLVALCQLAYVSAVVNISLFVASLAAVVLLVEGRAGARSTLRLLGLGLLGSLLAVLVYYRDFMGMVIDVVPRIGGGGAVASRYPVQGWLPVAWGRTWDFFGVVYPVLAVIGLAWLGRRAVAARDTVIVMWSWAAAYLLLLLGRARVPDLFLHGHETLFATPLICLAAGLTLAWLWRLAGAARILAGALLGFLVVQGLRLQWLALVAQTGNAR
jgi:hypothetical protein